MTKGLNDNSRCSPPGSLPGVLDGVSHLTFLITFTKRALHRHLGIGSPEPTRIATDSPTRARPLHILYTSMASDDRRQLDNLDLRLSPTPALYKGLGWGLTSAQPHIVQGLSDASWHILSGAAFIWPARNLRESHFV